MDIELRRLSPNDGKDIYVMLQEIPKAENGFINGASGLTFGEYKDWLVRCDGLSKAEGLIDGWMVPAASYWLYADGMPVAFGKLRYFFTDKLREEGGHIGYAVRPSARGKGYGKILLQKLLGEAARLGIDRALVTIHSGNEYSKRVALGNGGIIDREANERVYVWIDTHAATKI